MVSGMNGVSSSTFKVKVGWVRKATLVNTGRIGLTYGIKTRICKLALDRRINPVEVERIRAWFTQGPSTAERPIPIEQLKDFVPHINLAREMEVIDVIAVSPRFKSNELIKEKRMLALKLSDIAPKIKQFERSDADRILHEEARTLFMGDEGVDRPAAASGTLFDTGFQQTSGGDLLRLAAEKFFPLQTERIFEKDSGGFHDWMIDNIGRKPEMIGTYAFELSIVREMVLRGELSLDSPSLVKIKQAYIDNKGYWMKLELRIAGADYLDTFESNLRTAVSRKCGRLLRKFHRVNQHSKVDLESLAVLALAVKAGKLKKKTALDYLKGESHPHIDLGQYLSEVKNYLSTEEDRIFSLKTLIHIITSELS